MLSAEGKETTGKNKLMRGIGKLGKTDNSQLD